MKTRAPFLSCALVAGIFACSSTSRDGDLAEEGDQPLTKAIAGSETLLPTKGDGTCPSIDPLCAICPGEDTRTSFDEALVAAGCSPEKVHVNAGRASDGTWVQATCTKLDPYSGTCKPAVNDFVSYCPNSPTVQGIVAHAAAYGVTAGSSPDFCDKCLARPAKGYTWVHWNLKVSCPNCPSGCKPPTW
jgi:hypothetical protein